MTDLYNDSRGQTNKTACTHVTNCYKVCLHHLNKIQLAEHLAQQLLGDENSAGVVNKCTGHSERVYECRLTNKNF